MPRALRADSLRRRLPLGGVLLGLALTSAAGAQHPVGPRARALHTRLAQADAVAVATVKAVEPGRLRLDDGRSLHGDVPSPFQVKRSPGAPPPLAAGDRVLLLLRGARPPYVLVDQPEETIRLADADAEERWSEAVRAWLAVRERPAAWVPLYLSWIDGGPDTLRELAVQSLGDLGAPFQPVPAEVFAGLGAAAFDPARPLAARRAAARLAFLSPEGADALAGGFLSAADPDAVIAQAALRAAPREGAAKGSALLLRGLAHSDAEVRRTALRAAPWSASPQTRTPSRGCARKPPRRSAPSRPRRARRPRASEAAGPSRASDGASLSVRYAERRRIRCGALGDRFGSAGPTGVLRSLGSVRGVACSGSSRIGVPGGGCGAWPHSAAPETDLLGLHASLEAPGSGRIPRIGPTSLLEFSTGEPIRLCRHQERYPSMRRSVRSAQAKPLLLAPHSGYRGRAYASAGSNAIRRFP